MQQKWNIRPLAAAWCEAMAQAGFDDQAAMQVLHAVRDSPPEARVDREQFYQTLARQSAAWYHDTVAGKSLQPTVLMQLVQAFKQQEAEKG